MKKKREKRREKQKKKEEEEEEEEEGGGGGGGGGEKKDLISTFLRLPIDSSNQYRQLALPSNKNIPQYTQSISTIL